MIGIDIVKIERVAKAVESEMFKQRVFTAAEILYAQSKHDPAQTFAGLFAAKEAAAKALGRGFNRLSINDIEVKYTAAGQPYAVLCDRQIQLSISHDAGFAVAFAYSEDGQDINISDKLNLHGKFSDIPVLTGIDAQIPPRDKASHKGDYCAVRVIGGSSTMIGAPLMAYESARAALKNGAGTVKLCVPYSLRAAYQARVKEEMLLFLPDEEGAVRFDAPSLDTVIKGADAVVLGMGMGTNPQIINIIVYLCKNFEGTLIIDADGLNALSRDLCAMQNHKCKLILTPHIGEFNRLDPIPSAQADHKKPVPVDQYAQRALDFALKTDCVLVLKSHETIITDGIRIFKNVTGTPAMAKGGTGDVLAGMIAAFSSYMTPLSAAKAACYLLGKNGELAENRLGSEGVLASDIY